MKVFSQLLACLPGLLLVASMSAALERDTSLFVEPPGLEPDIQFWIRIYTEVEGNAGLLHDSRHIHIVYEEVEIPGGLSEAAKERIVEKKKDRIRRKFFHSFSPATRTVSSASHKFRGRAGDDTN